MQTTNILIFQFIPNLQFSSGQTRVPMEKQSLSLSGSLSLIIELCQYSTSFLENLDYSVSDAAFIIVFLNRVAQQNWVFGVGFKWKMSHSEILKSLSSKIDIKQNS